MTRSSLFGAAALIAALSMTAPSLAFAQDAPVQTQAATYTDAQVQAFAAASAEITPLAVGIEAAPEPQRTERVAQIRAALQRHSLDEATYNAIAAQAQTDTALSARIAAASTPPAESAAPQH